MFIEGRFTLTSDVVNSVSQNHSTKMQHKFLPHSLKGCRGIVFTHGVQMVGRAAGKCLSGLYLRHCKV